MVAPPAKKLAMILSHRHRLIVLHCRKAAGSSICVSLARLLGPADLQISAIAETLAQAIPLTRRVLREAWRHSPASLALAGGLGSRMRGRALGRAIDHAYRPLLGRKPPHAPARRVALAFPREWRDYRKLAVVRNPWDKTVSDYFWRIQRLRRPPSFTAYVQALSEGHDLGGVVPLAFHDNWPMFTIDDRVVADHIIRFETLQADLTRAFRQLEVDWDGWLPRSKSGHRPGTAGSTARPGYRSFYTPELERLVGRLYRAEIERFDYRF
ncbi:sulfotransferase family 2 domain-containing protein [Cyanobium sp. CH-040]|uniref:sulfotransferase family 2 domain-containing protein n=1 Tax=Cyanobium sp. CH-040 TaxID=2823708 RepID=UPI0020CD7694|nr:sulfotransferase family 2 domain-containing protein [Cyanobium sp. CH-040]MCP9929021.1 hypothetical protein [Cyanobium sp. CH-040]